MEHTPSRSRRSPVIIYGIDTKLNEIGVSEQMDGASRDQINDDLVVDCCDYYKHYLCHGSIRNVILCSHDTNLCYTGANRGW